MAPFPSATSRWHTESYESILATRPELSAKGRSVLITGAGSGIGAETARCFAQAGASRIALLGRREKPLLDVKASIEKTFAGVEVYAIPTDVTNRDAVDKAFASFSASAKIDVLVSNAAMVGPMEPVDNADPEKFLDAVQKNIAGSFYVAQAFLARASADAIVIDVNSSAAHFNFSSGLASYTTAKLAIFKLWDTVACGHPQMSIYHVQPGVVDTAMNREVGGSRAMGFADDVSLPANFHVWLASPEAQFLKGKFLWANWDVDELKSRARELDGTPELTVGLVGWPFGETDWTLKPVADFAPVEG